MAKYIPAALLDEIQGGIGKRKEWVCRRKHFKIDDQGHTVEGNKELYKIENKRDFKKKPQEGLEKASSDAFSQARKLRIQVQTEMPELLEKWRAAFLHQITCADADSPWVKGGVRKKYKKLDNYMETKIRLRGMNVEAV